MLLMFITKGGNKAVLGTYECVDWQQAKAFIRKFDCAWIAV